MVNLILVFGVSFGVMGLAGAVGYFIWIKTRPKKLSWKAKVYKRGSGVFQLTDKQGNNIGYKLSDLKPYAVDTLVRDSPKPGIVHHNLVTLKMKTPAVTADCEENWGTHKEIAVLVEGDSATLMTRAYDEEVSAQIFRPLPYENVAMLKQEISEQKERVAPEKDVLIALMPYVSLAVVCMMLIAIAYIGFNGAVEAVQTFDATTQRVIEHQERILDDTLALNNGNSRNIKIGQELENQGLSTKPPPIE